MICGLNCIKPLSIKSEHIQKSDILFVPREQYKISLPRNPRVLQQTYAYFTKSLSGDINKVSKISGCVYACCPFNQSSKYILMYHYYKILYLLQKSLSGYISLYTQGWMEVHIYIYSCTITTTFDTKKIILLRCFL